MAQWSEGPPVRGTDGETDCGCSGGGLLEGVVGDSAFCATTPSEASRIAMSWRCVRMTLAQYSKRRRMVETNDYTY